MLAITRNAGQAVLIRAWDSRGLPVEIVVQLVEANRDRARIGFEASKDIKILRSELADPDWQGRREEVR